MYGVSLNFMSIRVFSTVGLTIDEKRDNDMCEIVLITFFLLL